LFPFLGLQLDRLPSSVRRITGRQAVVALACLCLLCGGVYNNLYFLDPDDKQVQYDIGIDIDTLDHMQGTVDFIKENELDVGYAEFRSANIVTEATNGRTAMIPIDYDTRYNVLVYHDCLTNPQNCSAEFIEDESVFLLATIAQSGFFSATELAPYGTEGYEDAYYRIYLFDFPDEIWEHPARSSAGQGGTHIKRQTVCLPNTLPGTA